MARLKILSSDDFNKLYKLPSLGDNDRPFVFELDEEDKAYLGSFNDVPKKTGSRYCHQAKSGYEAT